MATFINSYLRKMGLTSSNGRESERVGTEKIIRLVFSGVFLLSIGELVLASNEIEVKQSTCPSTIIIGTSKGTIDTLGFEEYIKGVVYAELWNAAGWGSNSPPEALKAQAIAARTTAIFLKNIIKRHAGQGYDLCDKDHCQVWRRAPEGGYPDLVVSAVENTAGIALTYAGSNISAPFFSSTKYADGHSYYTRNVELAPSFGGFYNHLLRKTLSPEGKVGAGGHGAGMSQYGARALALVGVRCEDILKHYYGPVPPYVKKIIVRQNQIPKYEAEWVDNNDYPAPTRKLVLKTNIPLDIDFNAEIEIHLSERPVVGVNEVKVKIGSEEASSKSYQPSENPPAKVIKEITSQQLKRLASGNHKISIEARHQFAQQWRLDSNPQTFCYQNHSADNIVNYEPDRDENHEIVIGTLPPAFNVNVVLVIDRSGSMAYENKMESAKAAAIYFVDFMEPRDRLGVVDFDDRVTVTYPLTEIDEQGAVKTAAKNAIATLWARGLTSIGGGLWIGQQELDNRGDPAHPWAIVLLSDGLENRSPYVSDVLPDVEKKKTNVYTIGLGSDADEALMQTIASRTRGKYYFSPSAEQLLDIYNDIKRAVKGERGVIARSAIIQRNETKTEKVDIDPSIRRASFGVHWSGSKLELTLTNPRGRVITPDSAVQGSGVTFVSGPTYNYYTIESPIAGEWQLNIKAIDVPPAGEKYTVRVSGQTNLTLSTYFNKDEYRTGQVIGILASLSDEQGPITGATIEVIVQAPLQGLSQWGEVKGDRTPAVPLREEISTIKSKALKSLSNEVFYLYDDGLHDDGEANDGVYGNIYANATNEGTYVFNFQAVGRTSQGYNFTRQEQASIFVKQATQTASISGAIFYSGAERGQIYIQAWQNDPIMYGAADYIGSITAPGSYTLSNLTEGPYFLSAYMDINGNKLRDRNEPHGVYGEPAAVMVLAGSETAGIDITLELPTPPTGGRLSNENIYVYPNPFNPDIEVGTIRYSLSKPGNVTIKIYDIANTLVRTLVENVSRDAGTELSQEWNGRNDRGDIVANGIYFYIIESSSGEKGVGKVAVLR